jgi:phosphatidate cytidylyltransferase
MTTVLKQRVISGLAGLPIIIAAVWFDTPLPWLTILVAAWGLLAVWEFYKLGAVTGARPLTYIGLALTLLFIISPSFKYDLTLPLLLTLTIMVPLIWLLGYSRKEGSFISWMWTSAGILYIGWLLSYLVALRGITPPPLGRNLTFLALFTIFAADTTAFFVGRALGKHRLAPRISPGKTWEGAIGGALGAALVAAGFTLPTPLQLPLSLANAVIIGLLVGIFGQLGDLAESLLKRNVGVKDSGRLMPGHGGALDRVDSIVFAVVVVYYYVIWVI